MEGGILPCLMKKKSTDTQDESYLFSEKSRNTAFYFFFDVFILIGD